MFVASGRRGRMSSREGHQSGGSTAQVQQALRECGLSTVVREMPASTRTAKEAAAAIGCGVGQIAKSLVFRGRESGRPLLVIVSGTNRVNEPAFAALVGEPIERATPDFVRETTGYAIGGIPPVGLVRPMSVWMDRDLLVYEQIWAAAGTPFAVFSIPPRELQRVSGAALVDVK
jgi:prolyl-tRNA editing enzyme YbaK/EbsC (Cys-tRNA(Pro) deacylase)